MAEFLSKKRKIGFFGMLSVCINRDKTVVGVKVEESDFLVPLHDFKRKSARIMPWNSPEYAQTLRVDCRRQVVLQRGFTCGGQRQLESRQIFPDIANGVRFLRTLPVTAEIRMAIPHPRYRLI